jgi:hypothetical protein
MTILVKSAIIEELTHSRLLPRLHHSPNNLEHSFTSHQLLMPRVVTLNLCTLSRNILHGMIVCLVQIM